MVDSKEVLNSYLKMISDLSGAGGISLFIPQIQGGPAKSTLIHYGDLEPLPELENLESADQFAARQDGQPNQQAEWHSAIPSTTSPIDGWGYLVCLGKDGTSTATKASESPRGARKLPQFAWLGIRFATPTSDLMEKNASQASVQQSAPWLASVTQLGASLVDFTRRHSGTFDDASRGLPFYAGVSKLLTSLLDDAFENQHDLALLLINPDDYSSVNDQYGKAAGDHVIGEIAKILSQRAESRQPVLRYGGAIFAYLLTKASSDSAVAAAETILEGLQNYDFYRKRLRLSFSIGLATYDPKKVPMPAPEEIILKANQALGYAKRSGGGRVALWHSRLESQLAHQPERLNDILTGDISKDHRRMSVLWKALDIISSTAQIDDLADRIVKLLHTAYRADWLALIGAASDGELRILSSQSNQFNTVANTELSEDQKALINNAAQESRIMMITYHLRDAPRKIAKKRAYAVPLIAGDRFLGSLYMHGVQGSFRLEYSDKTFLTALASQVAVSFDRALLMDQIRMQEKEESRRLRSEIKDLRRALQEVRLIYRSDQMKELLETAHQVSLTDATVLITGESGTGKELIARTIHELSARRDRPLVIVDCSTLPVTLMDGELFGHERGAFTGAHERRIGRLQQADGGTVLLDEIGELTLEVQAKLLRFVQEKQLTPVGGTKSRRVEVRIIASTNRDLEREVEAGLFRQDLFYRLNVVRLTVPPLRQRPDDIVFLARHFLNSFAIQYHKNVRRLSPDAEEMLSMHTWPGNVRELQNCILQAVIFCDGEDLQADNLNLFEGSPNTNAAEPSSGEVTVQSNQVSNEWMSASLDQERYRKQEVDSVESDQMASYDDLLNSLREALSAQIQVIVDHFGNRPLPIGEWLIEDLILHAFLASGKIIRRGAALAGIPEPTFRRRLRKCEKKAAAGLSQRIDSWKSIRTILGELVRAKRPEGTNLMHICRDIAFQEVKRVIPDNIQKAADFLNVTPVTYRVLVDKAKTQLDG